MPDVVRSVRGLGLRSKSLVNDHRARQHRVVGKRAPAKIALARLGSICNERLVYNLNGVFNYLHVGWWLQAHGFRARERVRSREELFALFAADVSERRVLYLEFGVAKGASMRQWSKLPRNPASTLHGFDSILGLPHDWTLEGHERGYLSTEGQVPEIDVPRVRFFVGCSKRPSRSTSGPSMRFSWSCWMPISTGRPRPHFTTSRTRLVPGRISTSINSIIDVTSFAPSPSSFRPS